MSELLQIDPTTYKKVNLTNIEYVSNGDQSKFVELSILIDLDLMRILF